MHGIADKDIKLLSLIDMPIIKHMVSEPILVLKKDKFGKKMHYKSGPREGQAIKVVKKAAKYKTELNVKSILHAFRDADHIIIERQNPMIGNSSASSFTIGMNYGKLLALAELTDAKLTIVSPATWKKEMGLSKDKEASVIMAETLTGLSFRTKRGRLEHDRAEAILLAHWFHKKETT